MNNRRRHSVGAWARGSVGDFSSTLPRIHTPTPILAALSLALLLAVVLCKTASAQQTGRVFTAEELQHAGVTRLSDLYRLFDGWYAVSTNDYVWNVSARGLAPMRRSDLSLLLDGRPVDLSLLGIAPLDLLPAYMRQLDSVVVAGTPIFAAGRFAGAGTIRFYTHRPPPGFSVYGSLSAGNEVGDPGPYIQTDRATVNIDRYGPSYFVATTYGAPSWYARLSFKGIRHYLTDARLRRRIQRYYAWRPGQGHPPLYVLYAPRLALGMDGALGRHQLTISHASLRAFPFLSFLGYELPAQRQRTHVSLHGNLLTGKPQNLRYRLAFTRAVFDYAANRDTLALDWEQDRLRASVEYQTDRTAAVQATFGTGIDRYQSRTGYPLDDDVLSTARLYSRLRFTPALYWTQQFTGVLTRTEKRLGFQALSSSMFDLSNAQRATLTLSYTQQPLAATNNRWYWMQQGWAFARTAGVEVTLPPTFSTEHTLTADLHWHMRVHPAVGFELHGGFRAFSGWNLATYAFGYEAAHDGLPATTRVHRDIIGHTWTGAATMKIDLPTLTQRLHVGYLYPVSADPVFQRVWRAQPRLRGSYTARYTPVPRFGLRARLTYRAPTTWTAFHTASITSSGRYPARLPAFWLLNVTAWKRFWGDRLTATLSLRNLLNEPLRVHPAGTITRLMLHFSLAFSFGNE